MSNEAEMPQDPPRTLGATLRRLGPGMIIAGSIVGSGELIATTKVGAEAGFSLLWVIILGCVIKVFTQVEFGRYAILCCESPATARQQDIRFERITIADGLSHNEVQSITQDRLGFIWIATQEGLNRYDGYEFTPYLHNPNDDTSISGNYTEVVYEDDPCGPKCQRSKGTPRA